MDPVLRAAKPEDAPTAGTIAHAAFGAIASRHNFPNDLQSADEWIAVLAMMASHPGFYGVVAEQDGAIIGSNFLDERSSICGVGPISVAPTAQDCGAGRNLMLNVIERATAQGAPGVRLMQDAYHNRSFVLYTKLGFRARMTTAVMQGPALGVEVSGCEVRSATADDLDACNHLCVSAHGHDRGGDLNDAISQGHAFVVERGGRITGYTTGVSFFGHSVGQANDDLMALIGASRGFAAAGFHVPTSNDELLRWCFARGLRMVKAMTLMSLGLYAEPRGATLPSVAY